MFETFEFVSEPGVVALCSKLKVPDVVVVDVEVLSVNSTFDKDTPFPEVELEDQESPDKELDTMEPPEKELSELSAPQPDDWNCFVELFFGA